MVDDEQLLSVCRHAHHWPRQAEHLFLDSAHREEAEHQGAGGDRRPALPQTERLHVLVFGQVHHPLLVAVPRGEVQAVDFAESEKERGERKSNENICAEAKTEPKCSSHLASSSVEGQASSTASWETSATV